MNETYSCPFCVQQIPVQSKKCSFCSEWLKPGNWSINNPDVKYLLILVVALVTYVGLDFYRDGFSQPKEKIESKPFNSKTSGMTIKTSQKYINGKRMYVSGEIQNNSSTDWKNVYVKAEFFNKNGQKIDQSYDLVHVVKNSSIDFQIEVHSYDKSDHSLYVDYKLEIEAASPSSL